MSYSDMDARKQAQTDPMKETANEPEMEPLEGHRITMSQGMLSHMSMDMMTMRYLNKHYYKRLPA